MGIHQLLHSCCFLNTNAVVKQQPIGTPRILEAEWWQFCGEAWVRGQTEIIQLLGPWGSMGMGTKED